MYFVWKDEHDWPLSRLQVDCLMTEVGASEIVLNRIANTNGLMGVQTAQWGRVEASWTYNGFAGLGVNLEIR